MKISPIAQGTGSPAGAQVGSERMPADKIAAAKEIAAGRTPLRQTESDSYTDPQVRRAQRTIQMRTNASVFRELPIEETAETSPKPALEATEPTESAIPDAVGTANAVTEDTKPLSPQLAAIAKQRRALQVRESELKAREDALKAAPQSQDGGAEALIARIKSDPLSVLQEQGVTYDQLTEAILSNQSGVDPQIRALEAKIDSLEKGLDKKLADKEASYEQAVVSEMKREAESLVADGDTYEMVRVTRSVPKVMDLIMKTYRSTGEVLEVSEALGLVEEALVNDTLKIANTGKLRSRLIPEAPVPTQEPNKPPMRTLTNRDGASQPLGRKERAMRAFYNR